MAADGLALGITRASEAMKLIVQIKCSHSKGEHGQQD